LVTEERLMPGHTGNVLITGGLGYVGGRIASHLAKVAPELALRLMTHRPPVPAPAWSHGLELVQADLHDRQSLELAVSGVETVIHLAAVNEVDSQNDPDLALEVNGRGTYQLLQACQARGVQRFVYFSTFHVYGPAAPQPITEATATRPVHPYSFTHRLAEDYVNWFRHSQGLATLILRLSNGYGYLADQWVQRWTLVFNDLCAQAVRNREIRLRSSGAQQRDFIPLADAARAVRHLLTLPSEKWGDGLFNLGGDCSLSIRQVAQRVADEYLNRYGQEVPIIVERTDDSQSSDPVLYSIDKLRGTGFALTGNIAEEIQGTFAICEEMAREPASLPQGHVPHF
jgi:UDP-glucose 4-epimerase